jgi:hypothetical protein
MGFFERVADAKAVRQELQPQGGGIAAGVPAS